MALPESGCCCRDYHSEKSLYLLVQLQLHTSLAKKKVAGNTLLTLVHIKKMLYSTLEKCRLIENFISWTWKFWVGINFPAYFAKKDKSRNSYLLLTVWPEAILKKVSGWWQIPPQHQSTYLGGPESASIEIPPFRPHFINFSKTVFYEVNLVSQCSYLEVLLLSKFGSDRGDFNWCRFWPS